MNNSIYSAQYTAEKQYELARREDEREAAMETRGIPKHKGFPSLEQKAIKVGDKVRSLLGIRGVVTGADNADYVTVDVGTERMRHEVQYLRADLRLEEAK